MDKEKLEKWKEIAKLLSDKATYQDLELGIDSKKGYITTYLPELMDKTPLHILDIGAGTGVFCYVCQLLGHTTVANLPANGKGKKSYRGYRDACELFEVPVLDFTYGNGPADLEDNSFDVVNSQGMIGDIPNEHWVSTLDEMLRVVKPGGILMVCPGYISGVRNAPIVNKWAEDNHVEIICFWKEKIAWKMKKLAS